MNRPTYMKALLAIIVERLQSKVYYNRETGRRDVAAALEELIEVITDSEIEDFIDEQG